MPAWQRSSRCADLARVQRASERAPARMPAEDSSALEARRHRRAMPLPTGAFGFAGLHRPQFSPFFLAVFQMGEGNEKPKVYWLFPLHSGSQYDVFSQLVLAQVSTPAPQPVAALVSTGLSWLGSVRV